MKRRLTIGGALLLMNLAALALPLSGVWMLRLYESALIRQTESELIAQAGVIAALYRSAWLASGGSVDHLNAFAGKWTANPGSDEPWLHRFPSLDLAEDEILPLPPDPALAQIPPDMASVDAGWAVEPVLRQAQPMTLAGMRILDQRGVVVASTGEDWGLSLTGQGEVRRALGGEPVSALRLRVPSRGGSGFFDFLDRSRTLRVFVAQPVIEQNRVLGVVLLSRTPRAIVDALYGKRWYLAGLGIFLIAALFLFAKAGRTMIAQPIRAVTQQAKRAAEGERGAMSPLPYPYLQEVAELSLALSRMTERLEQRADYIRDFAAHVSHEFKTPLTVIQGAAELLRDHAEEMSPPERERFLDNIEAETRRLSQLVRRLLDLARADMMSAAEGGGVLDVSPILSDMAERYGAALDAPVVLRALIGKDALEAVVGSLLDNARKHAGDGARIVVTAGRAGNEVVIGVCDDGPGVSEANREKIFTPFFTTTRKSGGTGLGLAIARSLIVAYGGSLVLAKTEKGARFEARLKG